MLNSANSLLNTELRSLKQNRNWFSSKQTQWLSILSKNKQNKETPGQHSLTPSSRRSTPTRPNFHTKSDQGSDREQAPKRPGDVAEERVAPGPGDPNDPDDPDEEDSDDPNQPNIPELEGNLLFHECRGHWPYDRGCDACVQARGRTPARRRKQKAEERGQTAEVQLAADYTFIAGRHWRLLVMLMIHTGMLGIVVWQCCSKANQLVQIPSFAMPTARSAPFA